MRYYIIRNVNSALLHPKYCFSLSDDMHTQAATVKVSMTLNLKSTHLFVLASLYEMFDYLNF